MEAPHGTDENLMTVVLNTRQGSSFFVFLKFDDTFLFGFCKSNWNNKTIHFKENKDLHGYQSYKTLTIWYSASLAQSVNRRNFKNISFWIIN